MTDLNTPELGTLAELRFQQRCVERGINCFAPIVQGNKAVDYVIEYECRLVTVQVKKTALWQYTGWRQPRLTACLHGSVKRKYKQADCDYRADFYAFVCSELNTIWLIPREDIAVKQTWSLPSDRIDELDQYIF